MQKTKINHSLNKQKKNLFTILLNSEDSHFAIDITKNVFWFCVIALSALGLESIVEWEQTKGTSKLTIYLLTGVEYAVLIADISWFLSRLALTTYIGIMKVINEIKKYR
jgi:hypothetical protein